jgi:hypothetical protein
LFDALNGTTTTKPVEEEQEQPDEADF